MELLVALVDYAASVTATRSDDPAWGRVDGEHLPPWISAEQYRDACAAGLIIGATKVGRRWVAPRIAVEAWALAGARTAANDSDEEAAQKILERGSQAVAPRGAGRNGR